MLSCRAEKQKFQRVRVRVASFWVIVVISLVFWNRPIQGFSSRSWVSRDLRNLVDTTTISEKNNEGNSFRLFRNSHEDGSAGSSSYPENNARDRTTRWTSIFWNRLNNVLVDSAEIEGALTSGFSIKSIHNPKFYLGLAALAMLKWKGLFRNPYYWFLVAFLVKWYRARYVFKIPVWDRQPNWNNVITSKEQEKDLKAFTCKKCGSTIFIAKSREFFFEGGTGIGGLGCFSCGAKGKDNFVMDRERIVQDVSDMDDYFDYEKPLDFVSRAERKKLLKEAGGDENKANQILLERTAAATETLPETTSISNDSSVLTNATSAIEDEDLSEQQISEEVVGPNEVSEPELVSPKSSETKQEDSSVPTNLSKKSPPSQADAFTESSDEGLDALGMDEI